MTVMMTALCAVAQNKTVSGTVVSAEDGEPLMGAAIHAEGTTLGVVTDIDGRFSLSVPSTVSKLRVSYVGYETQVVNAGTDIRIALRNTTQLDEVMVVAYGTAKKSAFTGSAAVIDAAEIERAQVSNPLNALTGKVAGVQMTNLSGAPGADAPSILIRGISSITAGTEPLIVVDGAPFAGSLNTINTQDIASMTILKDAASNALYGARGANGVILITTKRAKSGEAVVTVDAKWGQNSRSQQDYVNISNPAMYYETYYGALNRYAQANGMSAAAANAWANQNLTSTNQYGLGYNIYTTPNGQPLIGTNGKFNPQATLGRLVGNFWVTPDNWTDEAYGHGLRQEYNLSVAKATDSDNFYLSAGYLDNEGITPKSGFKRFTGRLTADTQAKPWLKVGGNMSYTHFEREQFGGDEGSSGSSGNPFAVVSSVAPIYPLYIRDAQGNVMRDQNGNIVYDYGAGTNAGMTRPVLGGNTNAIGSAILDEASVSGNAFSASGSAEIRFLKDFKFTSNNSMNYLDQRTTSFTNPYYGAYSKNNGMLTKSHTRRISYTYQQLLTWAHDFGSHSVDVLLGHESYWNRYTYLSGSRTNMFDPSNMELAGMINVGSTTSYTTNYNNEGWLMRAQYNYDSKYFASASFRRDASSRFHPKHRWGNFWSFGGAWLISKENFLADKEWINMLKIKASYGEQGNDNIGDYLYINTYDVVNSNGQVSVTPYRMGNEKITWEKNGNFNAGVEFELFNNRLSGSVEYFYRKTSDMLFWFTLPPSMGYTGYYANVGDMANQGVELDLSGTIINTKDFQWDINLNLTHYKNKITYLPEDKKTMEVDGVYGYSSGSHFFGEGKPLYTWYLKRFAGVDKATGESLWYKHEMAEVEIDGKPTMVKTGNLVTTNKYSEADEFLVDDMQPKVYGGFGTAFRYKWFDVNASFVYSIGGKAYDGTYASMMTSPDASSGKGQNMHKDILNAWTPENTATDVPRYQYGDQYSNASSDRWLTDASYLSFQNLAIGFTLPENITKKLQLRSLRLYVNADNIWLWSKRQGLDPRQALVTTENGGNRSDAGSANNSYYSPIRTISGGINITF